MRQLNRTTVTNAVLAVILVALCGWLVLFAIRGSEAAPGSTPTEKLADQYSDISRAAHSETLAFLAIDHKRMDELTQRVLDGATGTFEKQYKASLKSLKETAVSQESISKGRVDEVGVSEVEARTATVFVAAGSKVQNKGTKGKVEDRSWRIKLTMAKEHGRWLVSQLEFVG
ncbi:MAG: Mce-associated rane protein [Nocardioidaceae bacterium]|nr:Mce-associated rane protein [Nocardioidaceae bacterium]